MKINKILKCLTVALATVSLFFTSCEDDVSGIGNSISSSEVTINVDSVKYKLKAATVGAPALESRSGFNLVGSISVPEYGDLSCSYVTQLLPAESLNVPDTVTATDIDSVKIIFSIQKAYVTGDTLAPQQLKVYSLTKQLPQDIMSGFSPEGYYNPGSPLAVKSYTLSGYDFNDTTFLASQYIQLKGTLPLELGRKTFEAYRQTPELFVWPEQFAQHWPGIYVEPSFGKGCVAPVQNTSIYAYYPKTVSSAVKDEDGVYETVWVQMPDSVCMFSTAPEVLSNVNISYTPSKQLDAMVAEGRSIVTTPGGYTVSLTFPAQDILDKYWNEQYDLGVINNMIFSIPAKTVPNSYGIGMTPALLMVKSSEVDSFFSEGKLPDNKTSFTSTYTPATGSYTFSSMRQYIVDLKEKGKGNITAEDVEFTLIPVAVSSEDYTEPSTGNTITSVTSIAPFIMMPTMAELDTDNATIVFTYSNETLY